MMVLTVVLLPTRPLVTATATVVFTTNHRVTLSIGRQKVPTCHVPRHAPLSVASDATLRLHPSIRPLRIRLRPTLLHRLRDYGN